MDVQSTSRHTISAKYSVVERIQTRGSSSLYRASHADTGRQVVVREFAPVDDTVENALSTLTRIASASSRFLADVLDVMPVDDKTLMVVHPLLVGESLIDRVARKGRLAPQECASLCARVLKGLDSLHRRKLVHGGLRPSRVFHEKIRNEGWHVKLLSACVRTTRREDAQADPDLAAFSPPEWYAGGEWTAQSDIWCTAALFYYCLTSAPPYAHARDKSFEASRAGAPDPIRSIVKDAPEALETLMLEALSPDPAARPASAAAMLDRLLLIYPEPERAAAPVAEQEHWTRGGFVGKASVPLVLPPVAESRTRIARRERKAVSRARITTALVIGAAAAVIAGAVMLRDQRRERAVEARMAAAEASARRAEDERAAERLRRSQPETPRVVAAPVAIAMAPGVAPDIADGGAPTQAASGGHSNAHHAARTPAPHVEEPVAPVAAGMGVLDFRSAVPCAFVIDGSTRGDVTAIRLTLAAGAHQITCHSRRTTERLVARVTGGRVTRVRITTEGETEMTTEDATPSP